jgi:hypothetical protein
MRQQGVPANLACQLAPKARDLPPAEMHRLIACIDEGAVTVKTSEAEFRQLVETVKSKF